MTDRDGTAKDEPMSFAAEDLVAEVGAVFRHGDANDDQAVNVGDGVAILNALFGGDSLPCADAADVNDDGSINLPDAVALLAALFAGGETQRDAQLGEPVVDLTQDDLGCASAPEIWTAY